MKPYIVTHWLASLNMVYREGIGNMKGMVNREVLEI